MSQILLYGEDFLREQVLARHRLSEVEEAIQIAKRKQQVRSKDSEIWDKRMFRKIFRKLYASQTKYLVYEENRTKL